jgi:GNAT superfamily N-acetyltransferase
MNASTLPVYISTIDEHRFGIRTARASQVSSKILPAILDFCCKNDVILLIARCPTTDIKAAQTMEQNGFLLMDTLVYYARNLINIPIPAGQKKTSVRPVHPSEVENVRQVAAKAFSGYFGHYHADERLDRKQCDDVYSDWAVRSCVSKKVADKVLVAAQNGTIYGFLTLRLKGSKQGEGVLFGVAPESQGRGIGRSLMIHGMQWCLSKGASRMFISTQITNFASQKLWTRLRFEVSHAYYTFHKWFDGTGGEG